MATLSSAALAGDAAEEGVCEFGQVRQRLEILDGSALRHDGPEAAAVLDTVEGEPGPAGVDPQRAKPRQALHAAQIGVLEVDQTQLRQAGRAGDALLHTGAGPHRQTPQVRELLEPQRLLADREEIQFLEFRPVEDGGVVVHRHVDVQRADRALDLCEEAEIDLRGLVGGPAAHQVDAVEVPRVVPLGVGRRPRPVGDPQRGHAAPYNVWGRTKCRALARRDISHICPVRR
ncbi:hypothetical protein [Dactylosporangium sp. CS-033363]|uniref:hypothetical protein n=1 Tax=Dactylosporangium sp. CS-033363 TaxID=3239935 RepID=UPI003D8C4815